MGMSRRFRKYVLVGIALMGLGLAPASARAADPAQAFIQARQAEVTSLLRQASGGARDKKVSLVLEQMIDFTELAHRSLAAHWDDLSAAQQKEFTGVLRQLVQRNYERNIKNILGYDVEYLGQEPVGEDKNVLVHTKATSKTNEREEPISIDYRMMPSGDAWRVVDIVTEGSSMVGNYKNQFHRIIQKDGYEALLKKMKDKLAKGQSV